MSALDDFRRDLRALLKEHGATINAECGESSDLYGVYDRHISVTLPEQGRPWGREHRLYDAWSVGAPDLGIDEQEDTHQ